MANLPLHSSRLAHLIYVPPRKSCNLQGGAAGSNPASPTLEKRQFAGKTLHNSEGRDTLPGRFAATVLQPVSLGRLRELWWCGPALEEDVRAGVEGDGYGGVAKEFLKRSWVNYSRKEQCSAGVPDAAEADGTQRNIDQQSFKALLVYVGGVG